MRTDGNEDDHTDYHFAGVHAQDDNGDHADDDDDGMKSWCWPEELKMVQIVVFKSSPEGSPPTRTRRSQNDANCN